ncbi:tyrosine-type recombinase/integrase [Listeria booriae]|uniref:tyrosine-type recombinase/integrase n=1 Tax=Listeria booriae TaxID=1552123 RepID=UPI0016242E0C|nr:tyrosine-type recombinase/integrase [Listeria booriae]MBC2164938.1 phage integrase family protein [Listeria booriae]
MSKTTEVKYQDGTRPLTPDEVSQLVQWVGKARTTNAYTYQTAIQFNVKIGLRVNELEKLKIEDLYTEGICDGTLIVYQSKTKSKRTVKIPTKIQDMMTAYYVKEKLYKRDVTSPVFGFKQQAFRKVLRETNQRYLGFEDFSTHSLRKTFANDLYNYYETKAKQTPMQAITSVQGVLGHSNPKITEIYLAKDITKNTYDPDDF